MDRNAFKKSPFLFHEQMFFLRAIRHSVVFRVPAGISYVGILAYFVYIISAMAYQQALDKVSK
jgi:hypothetical protein